MATTREERMHGRMRGGRIHQVEDIDFGPIFPIEEEEEGQGEEAAVVDSDRQQSEQLLHDDEPPPPPAEVASQAETAAAASPRRRSTRSSISVTRAAIAQEEVAESPSNAPGSGKRRRVRISAAASQSTVLQQFLSSAQRDPDHTVDSSSPVERKMKMRAMRLSGTAKRRPASRAGAAAVAADSSSSNPRAHASQVAQQDLAADETVYAAPNAVDADLDSPVDQDVDQLSQDNTTATATVTVTQSSPLARILGKTRRGTRPRISQPQIIEANSNPPPPVVEEPHQPTISDDATVDEPSPVASEASQASLRRSARKKTRLRTAMSAENTPGSRAGEPTQNSDGSPPEAEEAEEAEDVGDQEAAKRLVRKRTQSQLFEASPDLSSAAEDTTAARPKKRSRQSAATARSSPAVQKQPAAKKPMPAKKSSAKASGTRRPNQKTKTAATAEEDRLDPKPRAKSIQVPVQRFTQPKGRRADADDGEADSENDTLGADIPFSAIQGVNSVDVLSQLCEEVIARAIQTLQAKAGQVEDTASRRELKTKLRAAEAFREEMRTRFLEHTIALDNLQTLKKRLRAAQKEKRILRDEISRLASEREQVALRRDALRAKHETQSRKVMSNIQLSSVMHDVELAVAEGRSAAELSAKEQKKAELANLDLLTHRVADQIRPGGHGSGVLDQVKSFNAYLERAAAMLLQIR